MQFEPQRYYEISYFLDGPYEKSHFIYNNRAYFLLFGYCQTRENHNNKGHPARRHKFHTHQLRRRILQDKKNIRRLRRLQGQGRMVVLPGHRQHGQKVQHISPCRQPGSSRYPCSQPQRKCTARRFGTRKNEIRHAQPQQRAHYQQDKACTGH